MVFTYKKETNVLFSNYNNSKLVVDYFKLAYILRYERNKLWKVY